VLSTLHQSSLGALFLLAPGKLHPLWYSMYLPVYFLISAVSGGIGMIIIESSLSHRAFRHMQGLPSHQEINKLLIRLSRGGAIVLYLYFWLKLIGLAHEHQWSLLNSGYGAWWVVETVGLILVPAFIFAEASRRQSIVLARMAAVWTVVGLIVNRLNVAVIALNYNAAERYVPHWMEITVTVTIITAGVLIFEWMVNRLPILLSHPDYAHDEH